ncbi:tail needle knob protein [Serratia fonticola]|uniref:Tail needle knob protein n=1 Tax=Serratia fonticola TaxID=47917 RepID=A0ABY9PK43_SERFO|nr:tail needle knob protein [Serratia fonticola]WMT12526.1 tail needle knob protein [Serratia fonticola]
MADDNLNVPVEIQATRIDATLVPQSFTPVYRDYVVNQGTDLGKVAGKANEAGQGAWDAQVKNDEQDLVLADHETRIEAAEATLVDHEQRITAAEATLVNHEERITAAEAELVDHETRITAAEGELVDHETRITQNTTDISALDVRLDAAEADITSLETRMTVAESAITVLNYRTTRKKSELTFTGLTLNIPTTATNLVTLLKALTPSSGTFAPFFDTTANKMVVFNENKTVNFKLSIIGTWTGGTTNRSMQLTFSGAVPDTLVVSRNAATTNDNVLMATFFSVDQGGFLATNGSTMTIQSNGSAFTATTIKMIAEQ